MSIHRLGALGTLLVVSACGAGATQTYDDAQMNNSAIEAGAESAAIGELPEDASDGEVESEVVALRGTFSVLQARHQALSAGSGLPTVLEALKQGTDPVVNWDGTNLQVNAVYDEDAVSYSYIVDMSFTDNDEGGTTIDGTYSTSWSVDVGGSGTSYDLDVSYAAMASNGDGCVVGGSLTLVYDISVSAAGIDVGAITGAAGGTSGTVIVTWDDCEAVTITGT